MPGSVVDLAVPGQTFPDPIIVDANLIVEYLVAPFVADLPPSSVTLNARRAAAFFRRLIARNGTGIVTPTAFAEVIHVAVKVAYRRRALRRLIRTHARVTAGRSTTGSPSTSRMRRSFKPFVPTWSGFVSCGSPTGCSSWVRQLGPIPYQPKLRRGTRPPSRSLWSGLERRPDRDGSATGWRDRHCHPGRRSRRAAADFNVYTWL